MALEDRQDWLKELFKADPEDPSLQLGLHSLTAGVRLGRSTTQPQTLLSSQPKLYTGLDLRTHTKATSQPDCRGHGSMFQQPATELPALHTHTQALQAALKDYAISSKDHKPASRGLASLPTSGLGHDGCKQSRPSLSELLDPWPQAGRREEHFVPAFSMQNTVTGSVVTQAASHASSSTAWQPPDGVDARKGWETHRELLLRRADHQRSPQMKQPATRNLSPSPQPLMHPSGSQACQAGQGRYSTDTLYAMSANSPVGHREQIAGNTALEKLVTSPRAKNAAQSSSSRVDASQSAHPARQMQTGNAFLGSAFRFAAGDESPHDFPPTESMKRKRTQDLHVVSRRGTPGHGSVSGWQATAQQRSNHGLPTGLVWQDRHSTLRMPAGQSQPSPQMVLLGDSSGVSSKRARTAGMPPAPLETDHTWRPAKDWIANQQPIIFPESDSMANLSGLSAAEYREMVTGGQTRAQTQRVLEGPCIHLAFNHEDAKPWPGSDKEAKTPFAQSATCNLLGGYFSGKQRSQQMVDLTMQSAQTELAAMQHFRAEILRKIEALCLKHHVLEASERTVQRLIGELEQMRAKPGQPMSLNIEDVIQLVYSINLARGVDAEGPESYIATQYGQRCFALPYTDPGKGWAKKLDVSKKHVAIERAFAYAAGHLHAGEVELQLVAGRMKGRIIRLRDVVRMDSTAFHDYFTEAAKAIVHLLSEAERLQEGHATRRALEETLNQVCTEILCLSHVHYIFNPLHFRSPESWKYRNGSVSDDKWQALARAWEVLRRTGTDMKAMMEFWSDRNLNLEPLEMRQQELREDITRHFSDLAAQANWSVDYSVLLETVRLLKLSLDEAAVINSVAVTASNICVLNSWQMAQAMAAAYPYVINYNELHALGHVH